MPDKHVLQKRSRKHDNKLHIETCCDFFIKYLYMKGNSKKHRVSFPERFVLRNEKMLVYGLKNRGRLIHGIDLYFFFRFLQIKLILIKRLCFGSESLHFVAFTSHFIYENA